jgi:hypothetical protein
MSSFDKEVALLRRCEHVYGLPAHRIVSQLREEATRPLPDRVPERPQWKTFEWPMSGRVDLATYWREHDRMEQMYSAN